MRDIIKAVHAIARAWGKVEQHVRWTTSILHQSNYSLLSGSRDRRLLKPGTVSYETLYFCCHAAPQNQPLNWDITSLMTLIFSHLGWALVLLGLSSSRFYFRTVMILGYTNYIKPRRANLLFPM